MSDGEPTVFDIFKNFWIFLKQYVARADGFCLLTLTVLGSYYITILTGPITYIHAVSDYKKRSYKTRRWILGKI